MQPLTRTLVTALTLSAAGFVAILQREDIRTQAYADPVHGWAVPTIGAGSTAGVQRGDTITPLGAVVRAQREVREYEAGLQACLSGVALTQYEFDAYVGFAHNIGVAGFCRSSIARELRAGRYEQACDAILLWDRAGPVRQPSDRCSHPDNRTCRGLWRDRLRRNALCRGATPEQADAAALAYQRWQP